MPRKLKVYATSMGFFDQAVAAPSMKAALEAWGAASNLFHHGVARETDDPKVVAVAMSKPGVAFRRQVGTDEPFTEHADVSADADPEPRHRLKPTGAKGRKALSDGQPDRKTAHAYEREQKRRDRQRQKEEATEAKRRERRERAIAAASVALRSSLINFEGHRAYFGQRIDEPGGRCRTWGQPATFRTGLSRRSHHT